MKKTKIKLITIQDVKEFVASANAAPFDIMVGEGKFLVDGKSIMGIFGLDLSTPITVKYEEEEAEKSPNAEKTFLETIDRWAVQS